MTTPGAGFTVEAQPTSAVWAGPHTSAWGHKCYLRVGVATENLPRLILLTRLSRVSATPGADRSSTNCR